MGKFKVVEKFISINGEARRAGELACFIRFAGCNLNCVYCDTKWANEKNAPFELMSEEEIYAYIKESGIKNVTLTGGEPLLQDNVDRLLKLLSKDKELFVEIETNGSVDIGSFKKLGDNISFTVDYKLPDSGMEEKMLLHNYEVIDNSDTVKFVASTEGDLDKANEIITKYDLINKTKVYISTCFGKLKPEQVVDYMITHRLNGVRLQLQMHKYIWEPDRKGV